MPDYAFGIPAVPTAQISYKRLAMDKKSQDNAQKKVLVCTINVRMNLPQNENSKG